MAFYAVNTRAGQEQTVADSLIRSSGPHIHAVLAPDRLTSYVIVESDGLRPVENCVSETPAATKVLPGKTSFQEVTSYLTPSSQVENITEGDIVEVTEGAYAGQTAIVERINQDEEQVTVKLRDEPIPIPIDLPGEQVRVTEEPQT